MREGIGMLKSKDGAVYEGMWANDKFNGQGNLHYKDGDIYEGEWFNDHA